MDLSDDLLRVEEGVAHRSLHLHPCPLCRLLHSHVHRGCGEHADWTVLLFYNAGTFARFLFSRRGEIGVESYADALVSLEGVGLCIEFEAQFGDVPLEGPTTTRRW